MTPARRRQVLYKAANGASFNDRQAQKYGAYLSEIGLDEEPRTPQEIVDASRPVSAPTHEVFEWDDTEAAEEYRRHQARQLVNHIMIEYVTPEGAPAETRAFHSVTVRVANNGGTTPVRGYVAREIVYQRPDMEEQVRTDAVNRIQSWLDRWGEDDAVFAEADQLWQGYRADRARRRRRAA